MNYLKTFFSLLLEQIIKIMKSKTDKSKTESKIKHKTKRHNLFEIDRSEN